MEQGRKGKGNLPYLLFTGAMILCCVGLYAAKSGAAAQAAAAPEPTPTPLAHSYPAEDVFLENAAAFGLEAALTPQPGGLPGSKEYALERPGLADARLLLSFQGGGVCAFLLQTPLLEAPAAPKRPTAVEQDVYEMDLEAYEAERAWRREALAGLCAALDVAGSCTAVETARFYALLEETAGKGAPKEGKGGCLSFACYVLEGEEGERLLCASAARLD